MADFDPPPPPPPIHDHHPPPPIPCPRINSCTLTGIPIITIFEKYQVHYEFDPKLKKMALHKCRCQYVATELDLSILTSWWSQEHKTPIFMCFNHFSNCQEFYIFDKRTGGFEQVAEPRRCYPTRIGGNKVAATIYTDDENREEHVVIEAGHGESPKKLIWNNGQYLKLEPMTLNTFLMREIQEMGNVVSDDDDGEEGDEEDRKFKTYFDVMQPYIFTTWCDNNYLNALDRKTGLYTSFSYHNKQFTRNRGSNFNSVFENYLQPYYMEKYHEKCVFHCQNLHFKRLEQYIFDCTAKQFVQVSYEDLLFNPSKSQNFQHVLVSDGEAKFLISILNGSFMIAEFSEVDSCFSHRPPREVKTLAVQKAEKERKKKAKRSGDSDGRVVIPEKRRNEQGAQSSGANGSATQNPLQMQPSSSGVQNFNISSAKIIIRQNTDAQQPSQLSFSCQCSQQSNSHSQPQATVRPIQQPVQNPPQQTVNNKNNLTTVNQPPGAPVIAANGHSSVVQAAVSQKQAGNRPQGSSQQQMQPQPAPSTQSNSASTSKTTVKAHVVTTNNTQPRQAAQVLASSAVFNSNSDQIDNSSVSTIKIATAPFQNLRSQPQSTGTTTQQTVQNQPKQLATNPTVAQRPAESQVSTSAVHASQQPMNNIKPTVASQSASSAPSSATNVSVSSSSVEQQKAPQSVRTVVQKQVCGVQKVRNRPEKPVQQQMQSQPTVQKPQQLANNSNPGTVSQPASSAANVTIGNSSVVQATAPQKQAETGPQQKQSQQQMQPQSVPSTQSNSASTSVTTVKLQQTAQAQVATSAGDTHYISSQSVNSSASAIKTAPSINLRSKPQQVVSTPQQTGQNQPKQPASNLTVVQKPAESQISTSAVHASQQPVKNNGPQQVVQQQNPPTSATTVSAHVVALNRAIPEQPAGAQLATAAGNASITSKQNVHSSVSTIKPATAPFNNSSSQPQQTVSSTQLAEQNRQPETGTNTQNDSISITKLIDAPSLTSNSLGTSDSNSNPAVKSAATSSDKPKQPPTDLTVAQKPEQPQVLASAGNSSNQSDSSSVPTDKSSSPQRKIESTPPTVQKPPSLPSSNASSGKNVTIQFYNNNMFWMGSNGLVAQKQNAPISDSDLASILSQQQQSVNSNPATVSQSANAPSSGANVSTGNSSEAEASKNFQNGPPKASRKQMHPQPVRSTQSNSLATVNAQPQRSGQPKVSASSGVASINSNQSVNSATSPFANLTRGLGEADQDAQESRMNARAPRIDAYGPNGDSSVAQRTRSKQATQPN